MANKPYHETNAGFEVWEETMPGTMYKLTLYVLYSPEGRRLFSSRELLPVLNECELRSTLDQLQVDVLKESQLDLFAGSTSQESKISHERKLL